MSVELAYWQKKIFADLMAYNGSPLVTAIPRSSGKSVRMKIPYEPSKHLINLVALSGLQRQSIRAGAVLLTEIIRRGDLTYLDTKHSWPLYKDGYVDVYKYRNESRVVLTQKGLDHYHGAIL